MNPTARKYWVEELLLTQKLISFDGLWLDMNEASNFCNAACMEDQIPKDGGIKKNLVYTPGDRDLEVKSIGLDATHMGDETMTEFNMHSLFGSQEIWSTNGYFKARKERPYVIERSSFAGMGKYASQWLGDNFAQQAYMQASITGIYGYQVYGIPFAGADICGFIGDTNPELCTRWTNLGAFYPFSRNHADINSKYQEPFVDMFQVTPEGYKESYTDMQRNAIRMRYSFLRYYYTNIHRMSQEGGVFWKPAFYDYPEDEKAYQNVTNNIYIGDALRLSPGIDVDSNGEYLTSNWFYFPDEIFAQFSFDTVSYIEGPVTKELPTRLNDINIHVRGGSILPVQDPFETSVNTTKDLEALPVGLIVLPAKKDQKASGEVVFDDGMNTEGKFNKYTMTFNGKDSVSFVASTQSNGLDVDNAKMGNVYFMKASSIGNPEEIAYVKVYTKDCCFVLYTEYDAAKDLLTVIGEHHMDFTFGQVLKIDLKTIAK